MRVGFVVRVTVALLRRRPNAILEVLKVWFFWFGGVDMEVLRCFEVSLYFKACGCKMGSLFDGCLIMKRRYRKGRREVVIDELD